MTQRRVLILINGVVDSFGGNLRAAVNIAEALAGDGAAVTFSAPVTRDSQHRTVDLMAAGVHRRLFRSSRPAARFGGSLGQMWWLWRNARFFDEVQTHSLFTLSAVYAIVICAVRRVPIVMWPHGSIDPFDLRKHAMLKRIVGPVVTRWLLDRCAALIFTTTHESRIAVTYGSRTPHEVIPLPVEPLMVDGVDPDGWRARQGVPLRVPLVLFLGRIDYKKRLPLLVEALSLLTTPDCHLVVVGDGPDSQRELLLAATEHHGVRNRVHLTGWLEGEDRAAAFAAADVFALISDAENFGLSIIEAMSVGCPVVISDRVFLAEDLAAAGAAIRVQRDARQAAAALDGLLGDPGEATAMGERARTLVSREFAPETVASRLRKLSDRRIAQTRNQSR